MANPLYDGAYGARIFKPVSVRYEINPKDFCDTASQYIMDRLKIGIDFELKNYDGLGGVTFSNLTCHHENYDRDEEEMLHILAQIGISDDEVRTFESLARMLFTGKFPIPTFGIEWDERPEDPQKGLCMVATVKYDDFVTSGAANATKVSELD